MCSHNIHLCTYPVHNVVPMEIGHSFQQHQHVALYLRLHVGGSDYQLHTPQLRFMGRASVNGFSEFLMTSDRSLSMQSKTSTKPTPQGNTSLSFTTWVTMTTEFIFMQRIIPPAKTYVMVLLTFLQRLDLSDYNTTRANSNPLLLLTRVPQRGVWDSIFQSPKRDFLKRYQFTGLQRGALGAPFLVAGFTLLEYALPSERFHVLLPQFCLEFGNPPLYKEGRLELENVVYSLNRTFFCLTPQSFVIARVLRKLTHSNERSLTCVLSFQAELGCIGRLCSSVCVVRFFYVCVLICGVYICVCVCCV